MPVETILIPSYTFSPRSRITGSGCRAIVYEVKLIFCRDYEWRLPIGSLGVFAYDVHEHADASLVETAANQLQLSAAPQCLSDRDFQNARRLLLGYARWSTGEYVTLKFDFTQLMALFKLSDQCACPLQ